MRRGGARGGFRRSDLVTCDEMAGPRSSRRRDRGARCRRVRARARMSAAIDVVAWCNAPRAHLGGGETEVVVQAVWPETLASDWCGQYSEIATELRSKPRVRDDLPRPRPVIP